MSPPPGRSQGPKMSQVLIAVNGKQGRHEVAPRTHLGDFLRDQLHLTGTHLGCEHGVCGACTVLLDGMPVRSCITFAVACGDRQVTTIEGYDADPVMALLRPAFTRHHALQCGFCTPGMLASARDIVLRLPDADEQRVRVELSGNLCRCTGYMGIVAAVLSVLEGLRREPVDAVQALRTAARDGKMTVPAVRSARPTFVGFESARPEFADFQPASPAGHAASTPLSTTPVAGKGSRIEGRFDVPFPAARVWEFMADLPAVAACLPGAAITSQEGERVKGRIAIKFGPMSAAFNGAAKLSRDATLMSAVLHGAGQDTLSQSRATGDVGYRLEGLADDTTRVHVDLVYSLQGPLAQFSRSGLVRDFVRRMIADFGTNVSRRMQGAGDAGTAPAEARFNPIRMFFGLLWDRIRRKTTR